MAENARDAVRAGGLEIHHREYRAHGGTHRTENLEPVCRDCHKLIHRTERSLREAE